MKKAVRIFGVLVAAMFTLATLLTGCQSAAPTAAGSATAAATQNANVQATATVEPTPEPLKPVNLVMYLVGDEQPDAGIVYDKVNEKLKADINTTVECKYLPWADWTSKYSLIFASGENFDTIYTAYWAYYSDMANKNGFMELKQDMIQKYMPDYNKLVPSDFWDQVKLNGKIYMIPYLNKQVVGHIMVLTRSDLAEKYNLPALTDVSGLENYVKTVMQGEKGMLGYDGDINGLQTFVHNVLYKQPNNMMFLQINPPIFTVKLDDMTGQVLYTLDDPNYLDVLKETKRFCDEGFWSKSVLAAKTTNPDNFAAGKSCFIADHSEAMISDYATTIANHPEWKPIVTDLQPDKIHEANSANRSGMAIHVNSKNPERVLMMMNLFGTHKDYYDLTTYGIEGTHFIAVGDNKLKSTDQGVKSYPPKTNCPWGWERKDFMRYPDTVPDSITGIEAGWLKAGIASKTPVVSFNFVDANVKNELAACDNLWKTEGYPLLAGLVADPEAGLAKLKADLKNAGVEKVQAEVQKQMTEFLNSLK